MSVPTVLEKIIARKFEEVAQRSRQVGLGELEQRAAEALAEIRRVPIPLRDLLSPERCPEPLLPYLAWAFSVDRWHASWPVETPSLPLVLLPTQ